MPNYRYHASEPVCRNGCMRRPAAAAERSPAAVTENCPPQTQKMTHGGTAEDACLAHMTIAMAYVPWQQWAHIYQIDQGFHRGTIFEELDKPFRGIGGCCNGR